MTSPRDLLRIHYLLPKRSWGQNFLGDPDLLRRIAEAVELQPGDAVVELGAGLGHLTRALAATGARVVAVERDRDLVKVLEGENLPGVQLVAGNATDLKFAELAGVPEVAVAGNLPYHLSSPILFEVLDQYASVTRAVFTLQEEVVDRIFAAPGTRESGVLTVLLQHHFDVEKLFRIPSHLFHPPPKVESAVVRLRRLPRPRAEVRSEERFRRVVKAAFAQRRKTLLNSMRSASGLATPEQLAAALQSAGIDPTRRGETLGIEELAAIERALGEPRVDP
ncbi:MAG TPA: 16S rRNA (adenine(1518)-N(6)/adenine(1519)-N(6))-dimethyltransferase RsmA [Myxococcaceae bacterium]|nr:16S rRNA (adenine(1518)-N(6)/adenine(1519)-N(6))-dimethyltransferase RsmA [Myxococcaceae bacterium]